MHLSARIGAFIGIFIVSWVCGDPAAASPDRLQIPIGSFHTRDEDDKFSPFNPGLFAIWDQPRYSAGAGVFRNSYSEAAFAFVGTVPVLRSDTLVVSGFGALAYYQNGNRFDLSVGNWVPGIGIEVRNDYLFAQIFPSSDDPLDAVVTFGLGVPFSRIAK